MGGLCQVGLHIQHISRHLCHTHFQLICIERQILLCKGSPDERHDLCACADIVGAECISARAIRNTGFHSPQNCVSVIGCRNIHKRICSVRCGLVIRTPQERYDLRTGAGSIRLKRCSRCAGGNSVFHGPQNCLLIIAAFFYVRKRCRMRLRRGASGCAPEERHSLRTAASTIRIKRRCGCTCRNTVLYRPFHSLCIVAVCIHINERILIPILAGRLCRSDCRSMRSIADFLKGGLNRMVCRHIFKGIRADRADIIAIDQNRGNLIAAVRSNCKCLAFSLLDSDSSNRRDAAVATSGCCDLVGFLLIAAIDNTERCRNRMVCSYIFKRMHIATMHSSSKTLPIALAYPYFSVRKP